MFSSWLPRGASPTPHEPASENNASPARCCPAAQRRVSSRSFSFRILPSQDRAATPLFRRNSRRWPHPPPANPQQVPLPAHQRHPSTSSKTHSGCERPSADGRSGLVHRTVASAGGSSTPPPQPPSCPPAEATFSFTKIFTNKTNNIQEINPPNKIYPISSNQERRSI